MRWVKRVGLASVLLLGAATYGYGATPGAPVKEPDKASPSLDAVMGKKLISIDGSIIALVLSEEGLVRQITSSNGAVQKTSFIFINDRLGTVADANDTAKVVAVFRATETALEIEFADGTSELLLANTLGGISIEATSAAKDTYCTAWYPEGHVFSVDERKAALAQYAMRLGLGDPAQKAAPAGLPCGAAPVRLIEAARPEAPKADVVKTDAVKTDASKYDGPKADPAPMPAANTPAAAGPRGRRGAALKPVAPRQTVLAEVKPVDVRDSQVHQVPEDAAPAAAPDAPAQQVVASLEKPAAPVAAPEAKLPQVVASVDKPLAPAAAEKGGASSCLSIESDGSHWGFRNHCGYTVQFAYCQMSSGGQPASCMDGTVPGSVAPNGFGALVADRSLKETDVEHDFRWVACQGGAGEVIPRLEQMEPPIGRCVR